MGGGVTKLEGGGRVPLHGTTFGEDGWYYNRETKLREYWNVKNGSEWSLNTEKKSNIPADVETYLEELWKTTNKSDTDSISTDEFWTLISKSKLALSPEELEGVQKEFKSSNPDKSALFLVDVIAHSAALLSAAWEHHISKESSASKEWCELPLPAHAVGVFVGKNLFYNKKTGQKATEDPNSHENVDKAPKTAEERPPETGGASPTGSVPQPRASGADASAIAPDVKEYLDVMFKQYDVEGNGFLSTEEFWRMLKDCDFHLTDDDIKNMREKADKDMDGQVSLNELITIAGPIMTVVYSGYQESDRDWCTLQTADGVVYYYNKRTNISSWEKPAGFIENSGPDFQAYFISFTSKYDPENTGFILWKDAIAILQEDLSLGLSEEQIPLIQSSMADDTKLTLTDALTSLQQAIVVSMASIEDTQFDWVCIMGPESTFYYNKRTCAAQFEDPWATPAVTSSS